MTTASRSAQVCCGVVGAALNAAVAGTVVVSPDTIVCKRFIGFGVEWDSPGYVSLGVTDAEFATVAKRVRWMRLPVARVMMQTRWCYLGEGRFDWETPDMKALYRELDVCQALGTTVILTDWGAERKWTTLPCITSVDQDEYASVIGRYMHHLLKTRGYTCISFFVLTNEPNGEVGDFARWRRGVEKVAAVLAKGGLDKTIAFMGSDVYDPTTWHPQTVDQLQNVLGAYDIHHYADGSTVRAGGLEKWWQVHWDYVRNHDPAWTNKPLVVGEAGLNDDARHPAGNPHIGEFEYGVFMADYAVQAARAGSAAVLAWMLDDNSHPGFFWGLWDNRKTGLKLRPWFYPWSLLSRYFPTGSVIYGPKQESGDVRILAAHIPAGCGRPDAWSFCIVNRAKTPCSPMISVPEAPKMVLKRYVYSETEATKDTDGFPVPIEAISVDLAAGANIPCPAKSVVILTGLD